jgi:hypothetical protein
MPEALFLVGSPDVTDEELFDYTSSVTWLSGWTSRVVNLMECPPGDVCLSGAVHDTRLVVVIAHGGRDSFGDRNLAKSWTWKALSEAVCRCAVDVNRVDLFLSCCSSGEQRVIRQLFVVCPHLSSICGPRSKVLAEQACSAFRSFINCYAQGKSVCESVALAHADTDVGFACFTRNSAQFTEKSSCSTCDSMSNADHTKNGFNVTLEDFGPYFVLEEYPNGDRLVEFTNGCGGCLDASGDLYDWWCPDSPSWR